MAQNDEAPEQLNLEQILQTLASLPPVPNILQGQQQSFEPQSLLGQNSNLQGAYPALPISGPPTQDPRLNGKAIPQHRSAPPRPSTPTIDPATITEWKHGLRCVNKVAAQNPAFEASIQKMIKEQERHVRDWENGSKRIVEEQKAKRENEQTQRAAISLPGFLDNTPSLRTPERDQQELDQFHQKVYRACRQMTESHSAELKRLGVPFFGVKPDLLLPDDADTSTTGPANDGTNGKLTKPQLLSLQRKMLNHLVELYGD